MKNYIHLFSHCKSVKSLSTKHGHNNHFVFNELNIQWNRFHFTRDVQNHKVINKLSKELIVLSFAERNIVLKHIKLYIIILREHERHSNIDLILQCTAKNRPVLPSLNVTECFLATLAILKLSVNQWDSYFRLFMSLHHCLFLFLSLFPNIWMQTIYSNVDSYTRRTHIIASSILDKLYRASLYQSLICRIIYVVFIALISFSVNFSGFSHLKPTQHNEYTYRNSLIYTTKFPLKSLLNTIPLFEFDADFNVVSRLSNNTMRNKEISSEILTQLINP